MKAQDLWAGHEYAYKENKARGVETPMGALRVRVIKTERRRDPWNQRQSTYVTVEFLNKETGEIVGGMSTVRARDIFDWWDDYSDRIEERQRRYEAAQAEEERIKREKLDEQATLKVKLHLRTGIPQRMIHFNDGALHIGQRELKEWLNA
jgi:hypothetical protein